jgi:hypothetical protein
MDALQKAIGATTVVFSAFLISRTSVPRDLSELLKPRGQPQAMTNVPRTFSMQAHEYPEEYQAVLHRWW